MVLLIRFLVASVFSRFKFSVVHRLNVLKTVRFHSNTHRQKVLVEQVRTLLGL